MLLWWTFKTNVPTPNFGKLLYFYHMTQQDHCGTTQHLFSGSFCKHNEIIFLKDFPYFFNISLSVIPVSRQGGSFCRVNINTCKHKHTQHALKTCFPLEGCMTVFKQLWDSLEYLQLFPHLHRRVFVVRSSACGKLDGCDPKTPDVCFEVVTFHLHTNSHRFVWHERCIHMLAVTGNFTPHWSL